MNKFIKYFILFFSFLPLSSCNRSIDLIKESDNNSYIDDFELTQKNESNNTIIKIKSPKAIINSSKNNITIYKSRIKILNKDQADIEVFSGEANLDNLNNVISAFNDVSINLINNKDSFIKTNAIKWNLNESFFDLNQEVNLNLKNTNLISNSGTYDINNNLLNLSNIYFYRDIYNNNNRKYLEFKIKSDKAQFISRDNTLIFTSGNNQVETTIDFLNVK